MIFGAAARMRRFLYGTGMLSAQRLPRPVICVGNLSSGGTGKTPHVMHLAKWLSDLKYRVAILSRGYRRNSRGVVWVSRGEGTIGGFSECGDEPVLMARSLPGVPVLVGESRTAAGREALKNVPVDVFLLDDGFQHLSLARDFDLLLVDCERKLGNRLTLPFGGLREPPSHARFADGLVLTKCSDFASGEEAGRAVPFPADRPRAFSRLVPAGMTGFDGKPFDLPPSGAEVFVFSGLAGNAQFRETLSMAGYRVGGFIGFPDHHPYEMRDLARIAREAKGRHVITTEKDIVRIPGNTPFPVGALRVEVEFLAGWERLSQSILKSLERRGQ